MNKLNLFKRTEAFTIVELLIVIVVIGILAAISVVAYNGIQNRAHNTMAVNTASTWIKILQASYALNGEVDIEMRSVDDNSICLGAKEDYPAVDGEFIEGQCYVYAHTSDSLEAYLHDEIGRVNMSPKSFDDGIHPHRGMQFLRDEIEDKSYMWFALAGEGADCKVPNSVVESTYDGFTSCQVDITASVGGHPFVITNS